MVRVGGAWTTFRGRRLKVLEARLDPTARAADGAAGALDGDRVATGAGTLHLVRVQPEGKGAVAAADWLRGVRPEPGEQLVTPGDHA